MPTVKEYWQQIAELDAVTLEGSTISDAKAALLQIRTAQAQLRHIKRIVNLEMKAIRAAYADRLSLAGMVGEVAALWDGRSKRAGRADARRLVSSERDRELEPYTELKYYIDCLLVQYDGAKIELDRFIEEVKAEDATRSAGDREIQGTFPNFCPECGNRVDAADTFCRTCGHRL